MMLVATLGWVLGVWLFQQQPHLWSPVFWQAAVLLLVLIMGGRALLRTSLKPLDASDVLLGKAQFFLVIVMIGFAWGQGRAWWRLQEVLPAVCEQRPIVVQVLITGVPERNPQGQHMDARIERAFHTSCHIPPHVRLHYYHQQSRGDDSMASQKTPPVFHAGQRWQMTLRLKRPHATRNPHGFDYAAWCLQNHIDVSGTIVSKAPIQLLPQGLWSPITWVAHWREVVGERIDRVLTGQRRQSAVLRGLVIGDDHQIARQDWQLFVDTGINHLISISGLHITMLAAIGFFLTGAVWRRCQHLALYVPTKLAAGTGGAIIAILYSGLAGFSVPTQRTLYMLLIGLAVHTCKRKWPFSWILAAALVGVLLIDPWAVISPGFWLSFGAVSVLAYAVGGRLGGSVWWKEAMHTQWVITIAFVPVLLWMFNQVSLVSPLANALAIPIISLLVVPLAISGSIFPVDFFLKLASQILSVCLHLLEWFHHLDWTAWYHATPAFWAFGLAIIGTMVWMLPRGWPLRWAGLLLWVPMLFYQPEPLRTGQMRVTVLDVGQGLSVLVQTAKHTLLYDAGPSYHEESDAGQRIVLPYLRHLGIHRLDIAMVSHDDSDHVGGMASVLSGVPAGQLMTSLRPESTFFSQLHTVAPSLSYKHLPCFAGQGWQWDGVIFKVLSPMTKEDAALKDNDKSCVLHIRSASGGSLLLTGDIERHAENALVDRAGEQLAATVMTMPHHGSKTSSTPGFVMATHPSIAIATSGYLNRFGHPKQEVMARYQRLGITTMRSDEDGAVILEFKREHFPDVQKWRQVEPHYWEM